MKKERVITEDQLRTGILRKLIQTEDSVSVAISHRELDDLIARLMHLAELDSDKEHRDALKGELKVITRGWLDNIYYEAGYRNHEIHKEANVVTIN